MGDSLRIVILSTDEPIENWECKTFSKLYEDLIHHQKQLSSSTIDVDITTYDVVQGQFPNCLKLVDAIMITGSSASVNDDQKQWIQQLQRFIIYVWYSEPRIKMFGACFGHQILCHTVLKLDVKRMTSEIGVRPITLTTNFMDIFDDIITPRPPNPLRIQLVHEDHVVSPTEGNLPLGCVVVGATADCHIQGVYLPQRMLTFQGHAEFDRHVCKITTEAFFAAKLKSNPILRVECLKDIDQDDDGWWTRQAIWNFLMQPVFE